MKQKEVWQSCAAHESEIKPIKPLRPSKYLDKELIQINITKLNGKTLASFLKSLSDNDFCNYEFWVQNARRAMSPKLHFYLVRTKIPNPNYEKELKQYNKEMIKYRKQMVKYRRYKKLADFVHTASLDDF